MLFGHIALLGLTQAIIVPPNFNPAETPYVKSATTSDEACKGLLPEEDNIESCYVTHDPFRGWSTLGAVKDYNFKCCSTVPIDLENTNGEVAELGWFHMICPDYTDPFIWNGEDPTALGGDKESKLICTPNELHEFLKSVKTWIASKTFGTEAVAPLIPAHGMDRERSFEMTCLDSSNHASTSSGHH